MRQARPAAQREDEAAEEDWEPKAAAHQARRAQESAARRAPEASAVAVPIRFGQGAALAAWAGRESPSLVSRAIQRKAVARASPGLQERAVRAYELLAEPEAARAAQPLSGARVRHAESASQAELHPRTKADEAAA